jgi:hypothetical protein
VIPSTSTGTILRGSVAPDRLACRPTEPSMTH